jgi:UDPglucose 6-dehydrogenase
LIGVETGAKLGFNFLKSLSFLFEAVNGLSKFICEDKVIITKSTVPVGTNQKIKQMLAHLPYQIEMVSNPEFMREGFALHDFLHPNRIIIGCSDLTEQSFAKKIMQAIYLPWISQKNQVLFTDLNTAELIKYASNAFLMTKVAFINEIDSLCDKLGADVLAVAKGMGLDGRIGSAFLNPGPGIGWQDLQAEVRASGWEPAGERFGIGSGGDHLPEPWFRGGFVFVAGRGGREPDQLERPDGRGAAP